MTVTLTLTQLLLFTLAVAAITTVAVLTIGRDLLAELRMRSREIKLATTTPPATGRHARRN